MKTIRISIYICSGGSESMVAGFATALGMKVELDIAVLDVQKVREALKQ